MCRFTFYHGNPIRISSLITEPKHSLIYQSYHAEERKEPLNGDGFGLGWYNQNLGSTSAVFKSVSPAWNNRNLLELAQVIETHCMLAHVRAATQQFEVSESNCHPFKIDNYLFMHNGDIGGFSRIRRDMIGLMSDQAFDQIQGSTDSEYFFALLMDNIWKTSGSENDLVASMLKTIKTVVGLVNNRCPGQFCYFNFVLTNGIVSLAVRFTTDAPEKANSLYLNYGKKYVCENGICYMVDPGEKGNAVIVSSEPLSQEPGWEPIRVNNMILIKAGEVIETSEIIW